MLRETTRYVSPNVGAIVFYLCNRDPKRWQNTQKIEQQLPKGTHITFVIDDLKASDKNGAAHDASDSE
jgi:hypothetical protein